MKYLVTGSREDGAQVLKLQYECNNLVSSPSHVQDRRVWKMREEYIIAIDWLMMNSV